MTTHLYNKLAAYAATNKLKNTTQRNDIIDVFFGLSSKHVTIETLLEQVRKKNPKVGYATVYRTLMMLVDAGVASQRQFGEGQSLFEIADEHHHDHLICTQCGKIIEFENEAIEKLQDEVAKQYGFQLTSHRLELYGTCDGYVKNGVCSFQKS